MKALFLVDNILAVEMFAPIVRGLPIGWEAMFVNYDGWTRQSRARIKAHVDRLLVRYGLLENRSRRGIDGILEREKPDIIVLSREETTPAQALFMSSARAMRIPTLLVPHGALMWGERDLWGVGGKFARLKHIYRLFQQGCLKLSRGEVPLRSIPYFFQIGLFRARNDFRHKGILSRYDQYSKIACYGETMRDILMSYGVKPESIVLTGNPKFDALRHIDSAKRHGVVLLITDYLVEFGTWTPKQREVFVLGVWSAVRQFTNSELKIKIHPVNENIRNYENIIKKHHIPAKLYQREPIVKLIEACDIGITVVSSAGAEVMASGKPLIVYNPFDDYTQYREENGVFMASNVITLGNALRELQTGGIPDGQKKLAEEFVRQQSYLRDGRASERIVSLMAEMVKGKQ